MRAWKGQLLRRGNKSGTFPVYKRDSRLKWIHFVWIPLFLPLFVSRSESLLKRTAHAVCIRVKRDDFSPRGHLNFSSKSSSAYYTPRHTFSYERAQEYPHVWGCMLLLRFTSPANYLWDGLFGIIRWFLDQSYQLKGISYCWIGISQ